MMNVVQHSEEKLRSALVSKLPAVAKLYSDYTEGERRLLEEGLHPGKRGSLFQPITLHSDSDWIVAHPEEPQDFEAFYRDPYRKTPDTGHSTIYIQTIGSFGDVGLQTDRVNSSSHNLQILTGDLLRFLRKRKPKDAFCIVGITMIDLYPKDSWNFVFGQASLSDGMGVFSFARYDDNFYSRNYAGRVKKKLQLRQGDYSVFQGYYTPPITSTLLLRSCKTITHETGHMFGIKHCQWMNCVMQGSNHLEESDRRPLDLCPICLHKLQVAVGFKIADRYKALLRWMEDDESQLSEAEGAAAHRSAVHFHKPTEAFSESLLWLRSCLDRLEIS
ncbi:archaemetzincin-2 isoform X3 [Poecilia latipinna]|uniref:archaemetzincin-2 isoform X3 n=1 Tax=Poecilia latipinna TaxID=48699 RepID=UPI00072E6024|nr:PREDICTED: archaemetzincin-2 isoform X3 [Poecilia latipinna]